VERKKATKKKRPMREHRDGKFTGYEIEGDKLYLAPCDINTIDKLLVEERGLATYVRDLNRFIEERYRDLALREDAWWQRIAENVGTTVVIGKYQYHHSGRYIAPQEKADRAEGD